MKTPSKKFTAYWSSDFYNPGKRQVSEKFFATDRGYEDDEIAAIKALAVGEKWESPDYGFAHTVTRKS